MLGNATTAKVDGLHHFSEFAAVIEVKLVCCWNIFAFFLKLFCCTDKMISKICVEIISLLVPSLLFFFYNLHTIHTNVQQGNHPNETATKNGNENEGILIKEKFSTAEN